MPDLCIVGLGPSGDDLLGEEARRMLDDPAVTVVLRTRRHPAAAALARRREVVDCDDLYDEAEDFDEVYRRIAERVLTLPPPVVYAVPGSALVGERAVRILRETAETSGRAVTVIPGLSFLDLIFDRVGLDPLVSGVQVVDARDLPDPWPLHLPTVVTQVDRPEVAAGVAVELGKVLADTATVTLLGDLGGAEERVVDVPIHRLAAERYDERCTLFVAPAEVGWVGLVTTSRILRELCPWDGEQTHHSLVRHLIEEAYETVDAIGLLSTEAPGGEVDFGAYAELEEELGDLLLQVVLHATLAREVGAFDVEEIAEGIRRKLVARHPHVFGDVVAEDAATVKRNWERIKRVEKGRESVLDGVPAVLPALALADKLQRRAASVGFDWDEAAPVVAKVLEELEEVQGALGDHDAVSAEMGDLLFAVVNLARHHDVDPEAALRAAGGRFERRFRTVETLAAADGRSLTEMTLGEMDALWDEAKRAEGTSETDDIA